jgi:hypothetical protein
MTSTDTQLDLDAIEARTAAATPGPWGQYHDGSEQDYIDIAAGLEETDTGFRCRRQIAMTVDEPIDNDSAHEEWTAEQDRQQIHADAAFIAHARTDVPALLAEVRRLRSELAATRADVLAEVANELEGIDFHPNAKATCTDLCRQLAGRFRRKGLAAIDAVRAEETHVVADGSDDPEHVDDCPGCPPPVVVSAR